MLAAVPCFLHRYLCPLNESKKIEVSNSVKQGNSHIEMASLTHSTTSAAEGRDSTTKFMQSIMKSHCASSIDFGRSGWHSSNNFIRMIFKFWISDHGKRPDKVYMWIVISVKISLLTANLLEVQHFQRSICHSRMLVACECYLSQVLGLPIEEHQVVLWSRQGKSYLHLDRRRTIGRSPSAVHDR